MYFPLFVGVLCLSLSCYALLCVHSSFAIILKRNKKLVALLFLSYRCIVTINFLWLFLTVSWVGLQYLIVVFPDHTHFFIILNDHLKKHLHLNVRLNIELLNKINIFNQSECSLTSQGHNL